MGAIRLFQLFGITVFLDLSWFILLLIELQNPGGYQSRLWNVAELVGIFVLVLMHEFGHSLACRSVGGRADRIVLWPLGGIAFVEPPQRPGAVLWSIVAGPLVNVILFPVLWVIYFLVQSQAGLSEDVYQFAWSAALINTILLVFNLLPIYPLDGGQILQSILWFIVGRATSLRIAAGIGFVAAIVGGIGALWLGQRTGNYWLLLLALFVGWQAWRGYQVSKVLAREESAAKIV